MISNATACKTLGVSIGATQQEIKTAWKRLMKQYHPDQNGGDNKFEARCKEINAAYQHLSKGAKIPTYDFKKEPPKAKEPPKPEAPKPETKEEFWDNWRAEMEAKDKAKEAAAKQSWTRTQDSPSWQEESLKKTKARTAQYKAEQQAQRDRLKEKHDNFVRLSASRLEQLREEFRKFSNLGRGNNYAYTREEVDKLFEEIKAMTVQCRNQFWCTSPNRAFDNL